ncbi:ATP synthase subunit AtpR [Pseudorhodobacter sp. W20_MBD10_FR17]|uniref:ATP synthase subunit I n=1 Tax=Pseudorhodobacter sp. W20_MBD10_FR17 TaxID=3240266 RepID=UPI003F9A1408
MIAIDWTAVMIGAGIGGVVSGAFFAGLALGMRLALRSAATVKVLAISAALRIAVLLAVGWAVVALGGPWAGLGYGVVFVAARFVATTYMRIGPAAGGAQ